MWRPIAIHGVVRRSLFLLLERVKWQEHTYHNYIYIYITTIYIYIYILQTYTNKYLYLYIYIQYLCIDICKLGLNSSVKASTNSLSTGFHAHYVRHSPQIGLYGGFQVEALSQGNQLKVFYPDGCDGCWWSKMVLYSVALTFQLVGAYLQEANGDLKEIRVTQRHGLVTCPPPLPVLPFVLLIFLVDPLQHPCSCDIINSI